jgi:hypothetical protein
MNGREIIESYVRSVVRCLPRRKRNDVAFELRALLNDEFDARTQASNDTSERAIVMDLLKGFGRPADAAARYQHRAALIEPADTHHFLIWTFAGAISISVLSALTPDAAASDSGGVFLQWLGALVLVFAMLGWWRRRHPGALGWKPKHGPERVSRAIALLELVATLVFPVFVYAAPQMFMRIMFFGSIDAGGLELTPAFEHSWQRALTLGLLMSLAALYAAVIVQGGLRRWAGCAFATVYLLLGLSLVAHAAPMYGWTGGEAYAVFMSDKANETAKPLFSGIGGFIILCGIYVIYQEWTRISPAPARGPDRVQCVRG